MFGITDLTTYILGTTLIVILPGPNSLFVMSVASRYGIRAGYRSAFGVYTGDLILIVLTALGAASLLHAFPWLFTLLKIVGAVYLSYLGLKLLRAAYHTFKAVPVPEAIEKKIDTEEIKPFSTALTISILNPKAILFYLSFFVQFLNPNYEYPLVTLTALAVILQVISMSYLTVLIFLGAKLAHYFSHRYKLTASCVACVGLLFCGFGLRLATTTL